MNSQKKVLKPASVTITKCTNTVRFRLVKVNIFEKGKVVIFFVLRSKTCARTPPPPSPDPALLRPPPMKVKTAELSARDPKTIVSVDRDNIPL